MLRKDYPEYWALLLKWDSDSPVTFKSDGHTVHDLDKRFEYEDAGLVPTGSTFRWKMLEDPAWHQVSIYELLNKQNQEENE